MEHCCAAENENSPRCFLSSGRQILLQDIAILISLVIILFALNLVTISLVYHKSKDVDKLQIKIDALSQAMDNMDKNKGLSIRYKRDTHNRERDTESIEHLGGRRHGGHSIRSFVQLRASEVRNTAAEHRVHHLRNYKLKHLDGMFLNWVKDDLGPNNNAEKRFLLKDGVVHIKDSGVYFVYAQILYDDSHDLNGYWIRKNDRAVFQCTTTALPYNRIMFVNNTSSCFTGGIMHLEKNDTISLKDINNNRVHIFNSISTFFGLIKI